MERVIERLIRYTAIDSESGNEAAMAECLLDEMRGLGLNPELQRPKDGFATNAGNIYCWIPGTLKGEPLLLSAHMDTVKPGVGVKAQFEDGFLYSDGTTILGGDDKAGVAIIMESLTQLKEQGCKHLPLEIIFSYGEETGLNGAKHIDPATLRSRRAIVLDSGGYAGKIISSAPGQCSVSATFHGKAAHAGNAPSEGVSAIMMAAKAVCAMKLLQVDEETTANIGTLCAEGATNIVNPECLLIAEVRSRNVDRLMAQKNQMTACMEQAAAELGGSVEIRWTDKYNPFSVPHDAPLILQLNKAFECCGVKAYCAVSGGGSDANIYQSYGIQTVNLANGSERVHTTRERLQVKSVEQLQKVILTLLTQTA